MGIVTRPFRAPPPIPFFVIPGPFDGLLSVGDSSTPRLLLCSSAPETRNLKPSIGQTKRSHQWLQHQCTFTQLYGTGYVPSPPTLGVAEVSNKIPPTIGVAVKARAWS